MKLYIELENGLPKNHPALEENLLQVFGEIPDHWVSFERVEKPRLSAYDVLEKEHPEYQLIDGVYTDVWLVRSMTLEEKNAKQKTVKDLWLSLPNRENFTTWVFDEVLCSYIPPVPRPNDDKIYKWDGLINNWVEVTPPTII